MIIDKTKPEADPAQAYAFPPINVVVPDQQKQQLYQAIMTLITVVLSIALTLTAQFISQAVDTSPEPVPGIQAADPMQTLGTSHFLDLAVTGDVAVGDDITAGGDATLTGALSAAAITPLSLSTRPPSLPSLPPSLSAECSRTSSSYTTRTKPH